MLNLLIVLVCSQWMSWSQVKSLDLLQSNNEGAKQLVEGQPALALDYFLKSLESSPLQAEVHYNLALTFYQLGQMDNAEKSYLTALKLSKNEALTFNILFNLGEMFQKAKNKNKALQYYQQALSLDPENIEVKTNIELLTQESPNGGEGENQDKQNQDQQSQDQKNQDQKNKNQDQKDQQKPQEGPKKENPKQQKPQFKSQELTPADVNKILGEIKQQEQKIRAEFNKKESKEKPRDKDW